MDILWHQLLTDNTFQEYPFATALHWAQGVLVGWLLMRAIYRKNGYLLGYACVTCVCFLLYESLEQLRIADRGDVDVLNFALFVHLSAGATAGWHYWKEHQAIKRLKRYRLHGKDEEHGEVSEDVR